MKHCLPPQPTDTALARFVRRLVDCLPGVSIKTYKRLMNELWKADNTIHHLRQQAYLYQHQIEHLHRDIRKLAVKVPTPSIDRVSLADFRDEMSGDEFRKVKVTYIDQAYCSTRPFLGRRMINPHELSEWGRRALKEAAHEIARETAKTHALYIIDATLGQGIFKP